MNKSTIGIEEVPILKQTPLIFQGDLFEKLNQINRITRKQFTVDDVFVIELDTGVGYNSKKRYSDPKLTFKSPIYDTLSTGFFVDSDRKESKLLLDWFTNEYRIVIDIIFSEFQGNMLDPHTIECMKARVSELIQYSLAKGPQHGRK